MLCENCAFWHKRNELSTIQICLFYLGIKVSEKLNLVSFFKNDTCKRKKTNHHRKLKLRNTVIDFLDKSPRRYSFDFFKGIKKGVSCRETR